MSETNGSSSVDITAKYDSPNESKSFKYPISTSSDQSSVESKVASLAQTRSSVKKMQEEINAFLTSKMEQDKAAQSGANAGSNVKDEEEEANYGEEVVEDD